MTIYNDGPDPVDVTPTDPAPDEDLTISRVTPPSLSDLDALRSGQMDIEFNRTLTFWEREQLDKHGIRVDENGRFSGSSAELDNPAAADGLRQTARDIERAARLEQRRWADRAEQMRDDAERVNAFLRRQP